MVEQTSSIDKIIDNGNQNNTMQKRDVVLSVKILVIMQEHVKENVKKINPL